MIRFKITNFQGASISILYLLLIFSGFKSNADVGHTKQVTKPIGKLTIKVYCPEAKPEDSLELQILSDLLYDHVIGTYKAYRQIQNPEGYYLFTVAVDKPYGYFELYKQRTFSDKGDPSNLLPISSIQLWEAGDNITCNISVKETRAGMKSKTVYSGQGALKYNVRDSLVRIYEKASGPAQAAIFPAFLTGEDEINLLVKKRRMTYLDQYKTKLSELAYQSLKTDIDFIANRSLFTTLEILYKENLKDKPGVQKELLALYKRKLANNDYELIDPQGANSSRNFLDYYFYKCRFESVVHKGAYDPDWMYEWIKSRFKGKFRDKLLAKLVIDFRQSEDSMAFYRKVANIAETKELKQMTGQLLARNSRKNLSSFKFQDIDGNMIGLSNFRGKVKFIDFWGEGCGPCMLFYKKTLSKIEPVFKDKNVVFISVSLDRSKDRWIKGIKSGDFTSEKAVNLYSNGLGAEHPFFIDNLIQGTPTVLLVDQDDNIRFFNSNNLYSEEGLRKAIQDLL